MEISERVRDLVEYVTAARSRHGCKLMPGETEHLLDELVSIHTSIAILESSPGVNRRVGARPNNVVKLDPVLLARGGAIKTHRKKTFLTPIINLFNGA